MKFQNNGRVYSESVLLNSKSGKITTPKGETGDLEVAIFYLPNMSGDVYEWGVSIVSKKFEMNRSMIFKTEQEALAVFTRQSSAISE